MILETTVLLDGLEFPEGPRWHDGRLWFSDTEKGRVMTVGLDGNAETIVEVPGWPSGLGWLPDRNDNGLDAAASNGGALLLYY